MVWYTNPPRDLLQDSQFGFISGTKPDLDLCPPPLTSPEPAGLLLPAFSCHTCWLRKRPLPTKPRSRPLLPQTCQSAGVSRLPPLTCNPILPKTRLCTTHLVFVMDLSVKLCSVWVCICVCGCMCLTIYLKEPPLKDPAVRTPITLSQTNPDCLIFDGTHLCLCCWHWIVFIWRMMLAQKWGKYKKEYTRI